MKNRRNYEFAQIPHGFIVAKHMSQKIEKYGNYVWHLYLEIV